LFIIVFLEPVQHCVLHHCWG